jgi:adenylate cyclase
LVNAEKGINVWAQRYDRNVSEVFAVQDEITAGLIDTLTIRLSPIEKQRLAQRATNNLQAYDHFLEGQRLSRRLTLEAVNEALEEYKKAITIDPTYGRAYGAMAYNLARLYRRGLTDNPTETIDRAFALAEQAVELDGSIPQTHWSLGYVYLMSGQHEKAEKAAAESIRVAPNYADGYGLLALIHNNLGNAEKALNYATRGMQLNPYYTWDYLYNVGRAHYTLGNHDQAIDALEKAQERNENAIPVKIILAASYVQAGRIDDAEWVAESIQMLNPATTVTHTINALPLADPKVKQKLIADLRKAGLPE